MIKKAKIKFNVATAITSIIAVLAVLSAVFNNPPYSIGYGYVVGRNLLVVAAVFFAVCLLVYNKRIKKADLSDDLKYEQKSYLLRVTELVYFVLIVIFCVIRPLNGGMEFSAVFIIYRWLYSIRDSAVPATLIYWAIIVMIHKIKNKLSPTKETKTDKRLYHNIGVAVICGICLCVAVSITDTVSFKIRYGDPDLFARTVFNDYESFAEFMETEVPDFEGNYIEIDEDDPFYDDYRIVLKDTDGNILVDCEQKNGLVWNVYYGDWTDNYLPIKVMTYEDKLSYDKFSAIIIRVFDGICIAEAGVAVFVYFKKRMKKTELLLETENSGETPEAIEKPTEKC